MEYPINPLSAVGVDVYDLDDCFIGIDVDGRRVLIDFGEE